MSTLTELNALRIAAGMKPLKTWKESKAKLDAAVAKLSRKDEDVAEEINRLNDEAEKKAKPAAKKTTVKKTPAAKKTTTDGPSISTIAEECDIDPKVARAKMRRAFGKKEEGKWPKSMSEIKAVLKGDARKKD